MEQNPVVSIIIPVHNAGKYIRYTIESVISQTYDNWELILVNDCSEDDSVSVINEYANDQRIILINLPTNMKAAGARNIGIDSARGRYITFLDADDIWLPLKLEKEIAFIEEKDCAFAYTAYEFGDENAIGTGRIVKVMPVLTYKKALSRTIIFTSTVMFDTKKIDKSLIHMPEVPSEDTATWWQVLRNGYNAYGLEEVLTIYRRPQTSLSSNKMVALKRIWNLYRKIEKLSLLESVINFCFWAFRATLRRI